MNRQQRRMKSRRREHNTALTMAKAKWAYELERERETRGEKPKLPADQ